GNVADLLDDALGGRPLVLSRTGERGVVDAGGFERAAAGVEADLSRLRALGAPDDEIRALERQLEALRDPAALRRQVLGANDAGRIAEEARRLGLEGVDRSTIDAVRRYLFDSPGIAFTRSNYDAWRRLAEGRGTVADAAFLRHEIAELDALGRTGFDFMGRNLENASATVRQQWAADFQRHYLLAHAEALGAEARFVADRVNEALAGGRTIGPNQVAAAHRAVASGDRGHEFARFLPVDNRTLELHPDFAAWRLRAAEPVQITREAMERLRLPSTQPTLTELIDAIRRSSL
ncbi:MAG: hypothetical protein AAFN74_15830, partial [Myxococcota bacterium]